MFLDILFVEANLRIPSLLSKCMKILADFSFKEFKSELASGQCSLKYMVWSFINTYFWFVFSTLTSCLAVDLNTPKYFLIVKYYYILKMKNFQNKSFIEYPVILWWTAPDSQAFSMLCHVEHKAVNRLFLLPF